MALRNTRVEWGSVAKFFHWASALLIVGVATVGWVMKDLPGSPDKIKVYALHKSFGLTILALVLARALWRLGDPRPAHPPTMTAWQRALSGGVHGLLYAVMIAMPISGWLYNSASNFPLKWFDLFKVPALSGPDKELKALAAAAHAWGFWILAALFALHLAGVAKHHFVDRDDVLAKMLPWRRRHAARPAACDDAAHAASVTPAAPAPVASSNLDQGSP